MACNYPKALMKKDGTPAMRPCGHCLGCHLNYARQWATRAYHEACMHEENSFITLTYDNKNLPSDGSVSKSEVVNFIKRLRDATDYKDIRYLACGEYGDKRDRPHYHICLFGHDFSDKRVRKSGRANVWKNRFNRSEYDLYIANSAKRLWKKGYHIIGACTYETAAYVARYICKKDPKGRRYPDGREKEFALMSRRPALGKRWLERYFTDVYPKDFLHINGEIVPAPRYYDSLCKKMYPEIWEKVTSERKKKGGYVSEGSPEMVRKHEKELYRREITKNLRRHYEQDER